jgi:hypothetical protein
VRAQLEECLNRQVRLHRIWPISSRSAPECSAILITVIDNRWDDMRSKPGAPRSSRGGRTTPFRPPLLIHLRKDVTLTNSRGPAIESHTRDPRKSAILLRFEVCWAPDRAPLSRCDSRSSSSPEGLIP